MSKLDLVKKIEVCESEFTNSGSVYNDYGFLLGPTNSYFHHCIFDVIKRNKTNRKHIETSNYNIIMKSFCDIYANKLPTCITSIIYKYVERYIPEERRTPTDIPISPVQEETDIIINTNLFVTTMFSLGFYIGILKSQFPSLKLCVVKTISDIPSIEAMSYYDIILINIETYYIFNLSHQNCSNFRWNRLIIDNLDHCFYYGIYEIEWLCDEIQLQKANFTWFVGNDQFKQRQISWYYNSIIRCDYKYNIINNGLRVVYKPHIPRVVIARYDIQASTLAKALEKIIDLIRNDKEMYAYVIVRSDYRTECAIDYLSKLLTKADNFGYHIVDEKKKFNKYKKIRNKKKRILIDTDINSIKDNDFTFITDIFCIDETLLDYEYPQENVPYIQRCLGTNRERLILNFFQFLY